MASSSSISDLLRYLERLAPDLDLNSGSTARILAEVFQTHGDKLLNTALESVSQSQLLNLGYSYAPQVQIDGLGLPRIWGPMQVSRIFKPSRKPLIHTNKPSPRDNWIASLSKGDLHTTSEPFANTTHTGSMYTQLNANARRQIQEREDQYIFQLFERAAVEEFGTQHLNPVNFQHRQTFHQEYMGEFLEPSSPPAPNGWLMYEQPGTYDFNPRALEKLGVHYPYLPPSPTPPSKPMTLSEMSQKALRLRLTAWDLISQTQDEGEVFRRPTQWEVLTSTETPVAPEDSRHTAWQKLLEYLE